MIEVAAKIQAAAQAPSTFHTWRRHAIEIERCDATKLIDAHLAEQRLHRNSVGAVGESLTLDQHIKVVRADWPAARAAAELSFSDSV